MNKKIASIIYVFIIVLSLCGCGNSSNNIVKKSKKMIENDLLNNVSIYYESVYSSIDKNDYDKIIEYGDYTTAIYQIQNNDKQWSELPIK